MSAPPGILIHVAGVTAVWVILLSAIRFAAAGIIQVKPVGRAYEFVVEMYPGDTAGILVVWLRVGAGSWARIVNLTGTKIGYGPRRLYPQARLYRRTRPEVAKAMTKIISIDEFDRAAYVPFAPT